MPVPSGRRTSSTATSGAWPGRGDGLGGGAGLADDLEIVGAFEQFADSAAHHLVVVEQEHPDRIDCRQPSSAAATSTSSMVPKRYRVRRREAACGGCSTRSWPSAPSSDLPIMLRRITETAADLVDAKYAALGVLDESGPRLAEFITVGIDEEDDRTRSATCPKATASSGC